MGKSRRCSTPLRPAMSEDLIGDHPRRPRPRADPVFEGLHYEKIPFAPGRQFFTVPTVYRISATMSRLILPVWLFPSRCADSHYAATEPSRGGAKGVTNVLHPPSRGRGPVDPHLQSF